MLADARRFAYPVSVESLADHSRSSRPRPCPILSEGRGSVFRRALNPMGLFIRRPPKLVVRTLVATSSAIGLVLVAVFVVLSMDARNRIVGTTAENLDTAQRAFADLEQRRQQELLIRLNAMAENRSLAQALSVYRPGPAGAEALDRELVWLVGQFAVDALVLVDPTDHVIASAGPRRAAFPPDQLLH